MVSCKLLHQWHLKIYQIKDVTKKHDHMSSFSWTCPLLGPCTGYLGHFIDSLKCQTKHQHVQLSMYKHLLHIILWHNWQNALSAALLRPIQSIVYQ